MFCSRYRATITTAFCLKKQSDNTFQDDTIKRSHELRVVQVHPCAKCRQGQMARKEKLNDMDVEELKKEAGYAGPVNPTVKTCTKCGKDLCRDCMREFLCQ